MVLKIAIPSTAVTTATPSFPASLHHLPSFISCWPWCTNNNCGGISATCFLGPVDSIDSSSGSRSNDKSHIVHVSSAHVRNKTDASVGCHSIELMGFLCQENVAAGVGADAPIDWNWRRSHMLNSPLSLPDASRCETDLLSNQTGKSVSTALSSYWMGRSL